MGLIGWIGAVAALRQNRKRMIVLIKAGKRRTDFFIGMERMFGCVFERDRLPDKQAQTSNKSDGPRATCYSI